MILLRLRALSPLCHGGFGGFGGGDAGNAIVIRREPIVCLPGMPRVPVLSGNSLRGQSRRLVMRDLFRRAGLGIGSLPGRQWDLLYAGLANGGHLTGSEASPSPDEIRQLRADLPPLSIYGSALYRFLLPGRMRWGFAWPVCQQTVAAGLVPPDESVGADLDAADLTTETGFVRHVDRDQQRPDETGVGPMPMTVEALATGTVLVSRIETFGEVTAVEVGAVAYGLDHLRAVGGRGAGGLGAVEVRHDGNAAPYLAWLDGLSEGELRRRLVALVERIAA